MPWLTALVNASLSLWLLPTGAVAQSSHIAYVTSEGAGLVSGVDTSSNQTVWHAEVPDRPHNLEVTVNGLLAVATQGVNDVCCATGATCHGRA